MAGFAGLLRRSGKGLVLILPTSFAFVLLVLLVNVVDVDAADFASTHPVPRFEHWQRRQADIAAVLNDSQRLADFKLVFVGDSITDFWLFEDDPWVKGRKFGRTVWDESFAGTDPANRALNLGISGDRIEHVLHRIQPRAEGGLGQIDAAALNPDFIVMMLGINNTWAAEEPVADSVFAGVRRALFALHERKPKARIVVLSLLPTLEETKNREVVRPVNQRLQELVRSAEVRSWAVWLDLYPDFVDAKGVLITRYFTDGLHPNETGYRVWRDRLVPFLERQRKTSNTTK